MELRDQITRETSALAERLCVAAENVIADARREGDEAAGQLRGELETLRTELQAVAAQLEAETARAATLAHNTERISAALQEADTARLKAEADAEAGANERRDLRGRLDSARAEAMRLAEALEVEAAQKVLLQTTHATTVRELESQLDTAVAEARVLQVSFAEAEKRGRETTEATDAELARLRQEVDERAAALLERDARSEAAEADLVAMRAAVDEANAISDAAGAEMTTLRERARKTNAMLHATAAALAALEGATTVADVFGRLVRQLATDFERVAIFRVRGNHLEGDTASGLDDSIDIKKIVIPKGLSSLITTAASGGGVAIATQEQIADARAPFGGSPSSALAAPLLFDGEVVAVAYTDADEPFSDAHAPLATVQIRHANAILARLAHEVKAETHLRAYARTLLEDAEAMFVADTDAGLSPHDRLGRLRDSIDYAHDLYAHRAEAEGAPALRILDEEIAAAAGGEPPTPFATGLTSIARDLRAQRTAS